MTRLSRFILAGGILVAGFLAPISVSAQTSEGRLIAVVSSAFGDGGPAPALAVIASYPLFSRVRLEAEGTFVRSLNFGEYQSCPPNAVCAAVVSFPFTVTGNAASLGGNVVAEMPWRTKRIRPYLVGGAGVAHVRRERLETRFNGTKTLTTLSSTAPLLTAGGGVNFLLGTRVVLGADVRYQRMYERDQFHRIDIPPNLDLVRIGSAIGYRF
jgi:opacity protein-like surface antigen